MASLRDFLFGSPARSEQVQRFTDPQQQGLGQILQQALSGLQQPLGQGFAPIAEQARTQFQQQTIPGIAERFSGIDGQRSSGFQQALGQAGAGLEQGLAGQQAQFGLQQQGLLQQLLGQGLTPQFENLQFERDPGLLQQLLTAFAGGAGQAAPKAISGFLKGKQQGQSNIQQAATNTARQQNPFNAPLPQQQSIGSAAAPTFQPQGFGGISGLPQGGFGRGTAGNLAFLNQGF